MKNFSFVLVAFLLIGFAGPTMAAKNAKQIRHCGCVYDSLTGVDMVFHDVLVADKSQGHRNHLVDSEDLCFAGLDINEEPTYELWVRTADDCMISGANVGLAACGDTPPEEFSNCGSPVEE